MITASDTNEPRGQSSRLRGVMALIRPHQWTKNLLVMLPSLLAHTLFDTGVWQDVALAFVSLSLCASAVYVLNDRMDYRADRLHEQKRSRAFASGAVPLSWAPWLIGVLVVAGLAIAWNYIPHAFIACLLFYLTITTCYTFWLKRLAILDVLVLGGLYSTRIIMGGLATETSVSVWLLAFSMFIFSSMAFGKRYSELWRLQQIDAENKEPLRRRGYDSKDLSLVLNLGITTGLMAVLVLALYIDSDSAKANYIYPQALWGVCVVVFYWICNFWLNAHRGRMDEDVVKYVFLNWSSWGSAVIIAVCCAIAVWPSG